MNETTTPTTPHVYLVGGWGSDDRVWEPVVARLHEASVPVSVLDWQALLENPESLRLLSSSAVLAGWSLGGMIALQTVLRQPGLVSGLLMIASTARMTADADYQGVDPRYLRAMKRKLRTDRQAVLCDFSQLCFTDTTTGTVVDPLEAEQYRRQSESCRIESLAAGLDYLLETDLRDTLDTPPEYPKLVTKTETKIIHARDDAVMPYAEAVYLAAHLPHSELETLDAGTHALPITEPEKIVDLIRSLCSEGGGR